MKLDGIRTWGMVQRRAEAGQTQTAVFSLQQDKHLAVRAEPQFGPLGSELPESLRTAVGQPVLRRQVVRPGEVYGVAGHDRLVVGKVAKLRLPVVEWTQAEVRADGQFLGRRAPEAVIARTGIDLPDDSGHVDRFRIAAGDPAGDEDGRSMHGDLHAAQGPFLPKCGLFDQRVGNRIAKFVGVSRQDVFGSIDRGRHHLLLGSSS